MNCSKTCQAHLDAYKGNLLEANAVAHVTLRLTNPEGPNQRISTPV